MRGKVVVLGTATAAVIAYFLYRCSRGGRAAPKKFDIFAPLRNADLSTMTAADFMRVLKSCVNSPEAIERAKKFVPRDGDVVTLTTPKTGQTWLLAQLRILSLGAGGCTSDTMLAAGMQEGVDGVCWLEHPRSGLAMNDAQPGQFRVFKSHLELQDMRATLEASPNAKFITTLRAPTDLSPSLYKHMRGTYAMRANGGDGAPFDARFTPSDFALAGEPAGYEANLVAWLEVRDLPNVMIVFYEDMVAEPAVALRRLADFVGVVLDAELEQETLQTTSYERMSAGGSAWQNVHPGGGTYGKGRGQLSTAALEAIDARWRQVVTPATGTDTYEQLYEKVRGRPFPL
tara:strand:- start:33 stop:1064 length:1032 start_codon:yes stop_codon:yes gene_type:complete